MSVSTSVLQCLFWKFDPSSDVRVSSEDARSPSFLTGKKAAAKVGRIRTKSAPALERWQEVGYQAFGFALGLRDGYKKTLSFSLVRDETPASGDSQAPSQPPALTIRCPCTACGHLNNAVLDEWSSTDGAGTSSNLRIKCESCQVILSVKVTKRDPKLSI